MPGGRRGRRGRGGRSRVSPQPPPHPPQSPSPRPPRHSGTDFAPAKCEIKLTHFYRKVILYPIYQFTYKVCWDAHATYRLKPYPSRPQDGTCNSPEALATEGEDEGNEMAVCECTQRGMPDDAFVSDLVLTVKWSHLLPEWGYYEACWRYIFIALDVAFMWWPKRGYMRRCKRQVEEDKKELSAEQKWIYWLL